MPIAKRTILEALTRPELLAIAEAYELHVEDRRVRDQLIQAAAASRKVDLGAVLGDFSRDRLKDLCRELGHDDSGKEKAPIVARLLGVAPRPDAEEDPEDPEGDDSLEAAPPERLPRFPDVCSARKVGGGDLGFEATLWQAADKLRNNMDAAEYKHVVLGLIFLKYDRARAVRAHPLPDRGWPDANPGPPVRGHGLADPEAARGAVPGARAHRERAPPQHLRRG